jgi:hypothetical protein
MISTAQKAVRVIVVATGVALFLSTFVSNFAGNPTAAQVDLLIKSAPHDVRSEKDAFAALIAMGESAAPFIIGHLDDMRPLPDRNITLANNNPNVNETMANYEAEVVHDALSIILQQITHHDIGSRYDGAGLVERNVEREKIRSQWVDYCKKRYRENARYCEPAGR